MNKFKNILMGAILFIALGYAPAFVFSNGELISKQPSSNVQVETAGVGFSVNVGGGCGYYGCGGWGPYYYAPYYYSPYYNYPYYPYYPAYRPYYPWY